MESLGQRWANVYKWVDDHWVMLQEMLGRWQSYNDESRVFSDWLTEKENSLASMRLVDISDLKEVVDQVRQLKVWSSVHESLCCMPQDTMSKLDGIYVFMTQHIEHEMDLQVQNFDDLNDRGQELVALLNNDPDTVQKINAQLQEFQERWDNLVQQMEYQSKEVGYRGPSHPCNILT